MLEELVKEVMEYESDTFSASGAEITEEEARKVVEKIVRDLWDAHIDGVKINFALADIRPEVD